MNPHGLPGIEILAPQGAVSGDAISQWTEGWWDWAAYSYFKTGSTASGQLETSSEGGQMFFVGGSFDNGSNINGAFTVAAGTPLLVPVFNLLLSGQTGSGPDPKNFANGTPAAAPGLESVWRDNVTNLSLTLTDNATGTVYTTNVWNDFAKTGWFTLDLKDLGSIPQSQSVGYWAVVEGLKPGSYTLDFSGASKDFVYQGVDHPAFSVHVTDNVTVV